MPTIRFSTSDRDVTFPEGDEVNVLRVALRNNIDIPFKCASGNCGTDRIRIEAGADHCVAVRRRERERLGELLDQGYRLACQLYVSGDVTVAWDPDQKAMSGGAADERLKKVWLAKEDSA